MELPDRLKNFFTFYLLAFLLHYTEEWGQPLVTAGFMVLAYVVLASGFRIGFLLAFSLAAHLQVFVNGYPYLANHMRVFIGCNVAVTLFCTGIIFRRQPIRKESKILAGFAPIMAMTLVLTYVFAGFHKLNWGFLDAGSSCATDFGGRFLRGFWLGDVEVPKQVFPCMVGFVYVWELLVPVLLLFRKTQFVALPICILMHLILAPTGFLDFSSLAWAILVLFLNDDYHNEIEQHPLQLGVRSLARREVAFFLTLSGGWVAGFHLRGKLPILGALPNGAETFTGLLFMLTATFFLWPAIRVMWRERRFYGISLPWRKIHWVYALPIVWILFNGAQPYLGLSTGGAYSMFSNLRTEGTRSNHLLLGGNPVKIFPFQEDVVEIRSSPSGVTDHGLDIGGHDIPMVEFRKMLRRWRAAGLDVPLTFGYRGKEYSSGNICEDPDWKLGLEWYDHLLDFRIIPREGPNCCQW